jgi:acyl-CoA reductase-like NAD-dependent aldehyde dehydrogenase
VKEVAREMTIKAGQKCTAIRRAIVPRQHLDAVAERLRARLARIVTGDPAREDVRMGALASLDQQARRGRARGQALLARRRAGLRRARRLLAARRRRGRRRVLRAHAAAEPRAARATTPCTTSKPSARSAR